MNFKDLFENWGLSSLKLNLKFLEIEFTPDDNDRKAAWDMYVELLTRITTQPLDKEHGVEKTALKSIYKLFDLTRQILKDNGPKCENFAKIAIVVLNQIIRPFTAKWHKELDNGAFEDPEKCELFREALEKLRLELCKYSKLLSHIANVEDLTELESE